MRCRLGHFQREGDGSIGRIVDAVGRDGDELLLVVEVAYEEEAVGHRLPFRVDDDEVADPRRQFAFVDGHLSLALAVGTETLEILQHSLRQHRYGIVGIELCAPDVKLGDGLLFVVSEVEGTTEPFYVGQFEIIFLTLKKEGGLQVSVVRNVDGEQSASLMLRSDGLAGCGTLDVHLLTLLVEGFKGNSGLRAGDEVATFGIEGDVEPLLQLLGYAALRTADNVFLGIFAFLVRPLVDGEYTAVDGAVETEEVAGHLAVVEQLAALAVGRVLRNAEVHHPAGVGPYLVESGVERVGEHERSLAAAVGIDNDRLSLDKHTVG